MNKKDIQAMKTEIEATSALQVGYYTTIVGDIIQELGDYFLTEVLTSTLGETLVAQAREGRNLEAMNLFVTEAVRQMTYDEFQSIAHNFFSYHREKDELLAQPLEVTEEFYEALASEPERMLEQEQHLSPQELLAMLQALKITDICWDVTDPELKGVPVEAIPEHKKELVSSTLGEALAGFEYGILTGQAYKERFAGDLAHEAYIEPWMAEEGHSYYPIEKLSDDFLVLLNLEDPVQPFYWGRNYEELLGEMETLTPFRDVSGNRCPYEDGWDRQVDFEALVHVFETQLKKKMQGGAPLKESAPIFDPEVFEAVLHETAFYLPLEQSAFASLGVLTDKQLEEVREAQEHQLQDTREGMDQAAYEILEKGTNVTDIDDWVKDFKVGVSNLRQIKSEQEKRSEEKQWQTEKIMPNKKGKIR